jgi:uncharacterized protein YjdB
VYHYNSNDIEGGYSGLGYKWIILVPPQRLNYVSGRDTYVIVDYDLTYKYSDDDVVVYKNCRESLKMKNPGKLLNNAGKSYQITLNFYLNAINMAAEIKDWDSDDATTYPDDDAPHEYDTYFGSLVAPTGVTLDPTTLNLTVGGDPATLTATVYPADAYNKVSWSSSDTNVATVDRYGVVSAVGAGTAIITVTTDYGYKKATCEVTVTSE